MALADLVADVGFQTGLAFGAISALVLVLLVAVVRRPAPVAGIAVVVATVLSLERTDDGTHLALLACGMALLTLAAGASHLPALRVVASTGAAMPGTLLIALAGNVTDRWWAVPFFVVGVAFLGALAADFERARHRCGAGPLLLALSTLGVYACVPETGQAVAFLGAALPIALLGWPASRATVGRAGTFMFVGMVAWIATLGSASRPGAFVGAIACLGILVVEPVTRWLLLRRSGALPALAPMRELVLLVVVHTALVLVASRLAGLQHSAVAATAIVVVAYAAGGATLATGWRRLASTDLGSTGP